MGNNQDVNCPYCGYEQDICHDDGYGYEEDGNHSQECAECEKTFGFTTSISYDYEVEQVPCLNGGEHIWRKPVHVPEHYAEAPRYCNACGEQGYAPNPRYREDTPNDK